MSGSDVAVSSGAGGKISDPPPDVSLVDRLFESEPRFMARPEIVRSIGLTARQDSINWILNVHAHYGFRPVTAYLAVNYFDRILSSHTLPQGSGWPLQLLAVACCSLAAKMEEHYVPMLVDLQILEPKFLFEPKTVQRMELWVMARLNWRLWSITPFDYLNYFISKLPFLGLHSDSELSIMSTSSDLILNTCRVIDFLSFPPSTISAAAVLSVIGKGIHFPDTFYERANKEMVKSCHQLMEQYLVDKCHLSDCRNLAVEYAPLSPIDTLDVVTCDDCDTHLECSVFGTSSASTEAELLRKRPRLFASDIHQ